MLKSPYGTVSEIVPVRNYDYSSVGFRDYPVLSVQFWGETSISKLNYFKERNSVILQKIVIKGGNWTLVAEYVSNEKDPFYDGYATLRKWELELMGS